MKNERGGRWVLQKRERESMVILSVHHKSPYALICMGKINSAQKDKLNKAAVCYYILTLLD